MIELRPPSTLINLDADHSSFLATCSCVMPSLLAQADQFATQSGTLNNRALVTNHDLLSLSVVMWTPVYHDRLPPGNREATTPAAVNTQHTQSHKVLAHRPDWYGPADTTGV